MAKVFVGVLVLVSFLSGSGCNEIQEGTGSPLVVDLLAVARALGRDEVMTQKLDLARQQLNDQMSQISEELDKQLKAKESEFEQASKKNRDKTKMELDQLTLKANLQLRKTQQLANQKAILYRNQLVDEFRYEVMEVAEKIAQQRKASTIITSGSDLLWYASSIDITDEVIGGLRARANIESDHPTSNRAIEDQASSSLAN